MAVDVTLIDVASGYNRGAVNNNFTAIKAALQDALSRSGSTVNTMSADIDMDSNDILNAKDVGITGDLTYKGAVLVPSDIGSIPLATVSTAGLMSAEDKQHTTTYDTVASLLASTETSRGSGSIWEAGGFRNEEAAGAASDNHSINAAGVKFYETYPHFTTRARFGEALVRSVPTDGENILVAGEPYVIDSTATGDKSALFDLGIDGVRRNMELDNLYLSAHFAEKHSTGDADTTLRLSTSLDGVHFTSLNSELIQLGDVDIEVQAPGLTWFEGRWWIFSSQSLEGSHDFVVYQSTDLITWAKSRVALGGGPYQSATVSYPGGDPGTPCDKIWAVEPVIEDGVLWVVLVVRYGADYVDALGDTIPHFKPIISECLDPDNLTFGVPIEPDMGNTVSKNAPQIVKQADNYWFVCKNASSKDVELYKSTVGITGPYTLDNTIVDANRAFEGECLTRYRYYDLDDATVKTSWRLYVDNNRTGPGETPAGELVGTPYYFETQNSNPNGGWGSIQRAHFPTPVRAGSVVNLAFLPPEAARSLERAAAAKTDPRVNFGESLEFDNGAKVLWPQPDFMYYVETTGRDAIVDLRDGAADRFYMAVFNDDAATGITILQGENSATQVLIGYGRNSMNVLEFRRRNDGLYHIIGDNIKSEFLATFNGVDEVITQNTDTSLLWTDIPINNGSDYDSGQNRWEPPAGVVDIYATVTIKSGVEADETNKIQITKNGTTMNTVFTYQAGAINAVMQISLLGDRTDGTDSYKISVRANGTTTKTVDGATNSTSFRGVCR